VTPRLWVVWRGGVGNRGGTGRTKHRGRVAIRGGGGDYFTFFRTEGETAFSLGLLIQGREGGFSGGEERLGKREEIVGKEFKNGRQEWVVGIGRKEMGRKHHRARNQSQTWDRNGGSEHQLGTAKKEEEKGKIHTQGNLYIMQSQGEGKEGESKTNGRKRETRKRGLSCVFLVKRGSFG